MIDGATVHDPDELNKIKHVIQAAKEDTEIFPHLNNYNPHTQSWDAGVGDMLQGPGQARRAAPADRPLPHRVTRPIAASRWTLKASPTTPIRPI